MLTSVIALVIVTCKVQHDLGGFFNFRRGYGLDEVNIYAPVDVVVVRAEVQREQVLRRY